MSSFEKQILLEIFKSKKDAKSNRLSDVITRKKYENERDNFLKINPNITVIAFPF